MSINKVSPAYKSLILLAMSQVQILPPRPYQPDKINNEEIR